MKMVAIVMETGNALEPGITVTQSIEKPTNPSINDEYNDPRTGIVEVWNGSEWCVKNLTQDLKDEIAIFKANYNNVTDVATKKCLKALGKALLKLYNESL